MNLTLPDEISSTASVVVIGSKCMDRLGSTTSMGYVLVASLKERVDEVKLLKFNCLH